MADTDRRLHILVLADGIFPFVVGGMQRHSSYVVRYLLARGHEVTLGHTITDKSPLPSRGEVTKALGISDDAPFHHTCIRFPSLGVAPGHYLKESYAASRILFDGFRPMLNQVDFIYAKGFTGWYFIEQRIRRKADCPPVGVKFHGYEMFQTHTGWRGWWEKLLLRPPVKWISRHADVVFSYGGKITDIIRSVGVPLARIAEVPSGIEDAWCLPEAPKRTGPVRLLFLGRFERRKGIGDLHRAVAALPSNGQWELELIGPIPPSARLRSAQVTYHGAVTDREKLLTIMDRCDILVVPSYAEGMPNVILEGMARGLAIIATDVGAVNLMVSNRNGWLLHKADEKLLTQTLTEAITVPRDQLALMQAASLDLVKDRYRWEAVADQLDKEIRRFSALKR